MQTWNVLSQCTISQSTIKILFLNNPCQFNSSALEKNPIQHHIELQSWLSLEAKKWSPTFQRDRNSSWNLLSQLRRKSRSVRFHARHWMPDILQRGRVGGGRRRRKIMVKWKERTDENKNTVLAVQVAFFSGTWLVLFFAKTKVQDETPGTVSPRVCVDRACASGLAWCKGPLQSLCMWLWLCFLNLYSVCVWGGGGTSTQRRKETTRRACGGTLCLWVGHLAWFPFTSHPAQPYSLWENCPKTLLSVQSSISTFVLKQMTK
jgi:hypothetical protein